MRHRVYGKHLGRNKDERRNLFKGLVRSLFSYGTIQTSEVKAKAIKGLVDKIINSAKSNSKSASLVQSFVADKGLRERLIKEIVPKLGSRTSGFTRTIRMGTQLGDQATIVKMSLIGAEELKPIESKSRIKNQELSKKPKELKIQTIITPPGRPAKAKTVQTKRRSKKA